MKRLLFYALAALLALALAAPAAAQTSDAPILGLWKTIDDETERPRSIVRVYERGGKVHGDIVKLFREPDEVQDPVCDECDGEREGQRVLGMNILWDLEADGDEYKGGRILDPANGKTYRAKLWLEEGDLRVRGYLGPFHRTQTWLPATEADLE
jgi:uncharacterized protein (DUF2147 family)